MSNQYPGNTPDNAPGATPDGTPDRTRESNRTGTIVISILVVLLLIAAITIGWLFANQDSEDEATTATMTTSPVETITDSSPEPGTVTVTNTDTNTVPVEPTTATITQEPTDPQTTTTGQISLPADACEPETFQEAGHDFVDLVMFCDSGWARGGRFQTDNVRPFHWVDGAWAIYPPAGESSITGYPCYDTQAMSDEGAPNLLLMETLDCEFA